MAYFAAALASVAATMAMAETPLPRPRPVPLQERFVVQPSGEPASPASSALPLAPAPELQGPVFPPAVAGPSACELRLSAVAQFTPLPVLMGPGECGATDVVRLESVRMPDNTFVAVSPTTLRCGMAEAFAIFVRQDIGPAALALGSPLKAIANYDSYECRGRNRVAGAKLSEHARGNALDIRSVRLASGHVFDLTDPKVPKDFRDRVRTAACGRFTTVLGPGSDSYHETHIHLDLAERSRGYRMCQWDVREPKPEPKLEPKVAVSVESKSESVSDAVSESKIAPIAAGDVPLPQPRPAWLDRRRLRSRI
jgi:hypothetical protein